MSDFNMPPGVRASSIPGSEDDPDYEGQHQAHAVLTLRDYFAAKAMGAFVVLLRDDEKQECPYSSAEEAADLSYLFADAMLMRRTR